MSAANLWWAVDNSLRALKFGGSASDAGLLDKVPATLSYGFGDVRAVLALPAIYHVKLRTPLSVLTREIRRRERVIRIFLNEQSASRRIGALLVEVNGDWSTDRRYMDMTLYHKWREANSLPLPAVVLDRPPARSFLQKDLDLTTCDFGKSNRSS